MSLAKDFAEDWYLVLRGKHHRGELKNEKIFSFAAKQFTREYDIITQGQRSEKWVKGHHDRLRLHLLPFFGELGLSEVSAGKVQDYRIHRMENTESGRPPARSTLHDETVTLRQVLKTAMRHGWLKHLPDLSSPYNSQTKISHRAWFTAKEYKQLYEATRRRASKPKNPRFKWNAEQLHDYVLFMANTSEFKQEAVRVALTSGLTRKQVASDFKIAFSTLSRWIREERDHVIESEPRSDLIQENERLRKEIRLLREEREILKKATQFFARLKS